MQKKILLLSGYDAKSHKLWRERLVSLLPEYQWTQLTLPPRNFNWRIRSNSLHWASTQRKTLCGDYDLLLATSMVDLSSLRGLVPELCRLPTAIYFHENQFAYPPNKQAEKNIEPILVPIYAALCADKLIFNSEYNRNTFLEGTKNLFKKLPDKLPKEVLEKFENNRIIPVPAENPGKVKHTSSTNQINVVWNHRWEYDKGPERLMRLIAEIDERRLPICFHIVGEQFRETPRVFEDIQLKLSSHSKRLSMEPGTFGYISNHFEYYSLLQKSDVVLSTALHDFQGLAVQEACLAGCSPLTPNALAYPEYIPTNCMYKNIDDEKLQTSEIITMLIKLLELKQRNFALPQVDLKHYTGKFLKNKYNQLIQELSASKG